MTRQTYDILWPNGQSQQVHDTLTLAQLTFYHWPKRVLVYDADSGEVLEELDSRLRQVWQAGQLMVECQPLDDGLLLGVGDDAVGLTWLEVVSLLLQVSGGAEVESGASFLAGDTFSAQCRGESVILNFVGEVNTLFLDGPHARAFERQLRSQVEANEVGRKLLAQMRPVEGNWHQKLPHPFAKKELAKNTLGALDYRPKWESDRRRTQAELQARGKKLSRQLH
ncbi:hypothetical protein Dxin01_00781 [Deinococcus xinjiangensis]|uniref:Uncharacterized protein n=1 Tax=Deinococcus xinjiangensis TaxID=457454 RepID=A0ABP9VA47_9DEIO